MESPPPINPFDPRITGDRMLIPQPGGPYGYGMPGAGGQGITPPFSQQGFAPPGGVPGQPPVAPGGAQGGAPGGYTQVSDILNQIAPGGLLSLGGQNVYGGLTGGQTAPEQATGGLPLGPEGPFVPQPSPGGPAAPPSGPSELDKLWALQDLNYLRSMGAGEVPMLPPSRQAGYQFTGQEATPVGGLDYMTLQNISQGRG